jgi:hypothetical protein
MTRVENDIVQLVKTLIVEHKISVDEAKVMARKMLQGKLNQMLTEEEKEGIKDLNSTTDAMIKVSKEDAVIVGPIRVYARKVYELLKTMGFK